MPKILKVVSRYYALFGISGVLLWLYARVSGKRPILAKDIPGVKQPVHLRLGSTDPAVFRQVFMERHYDVSLPGVPKVIIDAGANIGLSAVFFANKYPHSRIIAIEPAQSNFDMLVKNSAPYPQIKPLRAALWNRVGEISLMDPGSGDHGFQTGGVASTSTRRLGLVPATTIDALMHDLQLEHIDILKIDIEGAEKEVFESAVGWIDSVDCIMAELHDNLKPGCTTAFSEATRSLPAEFIKGETVVRLRHSA